MDNNFKLFLICCVIVFVAYIVFVIRFNRSNSKGLNKLVVKNKKNKEVLYTIYIYLNKFKPTHFYLNYIKDKLSKITEIDEYELNKLAVKNSVVLLSVTGFLLSLILFSGENIIFKLTGVLVVFMLHNELIDKTINRLEVELLHSFEQFISTIRHYYHEHNMIDEAVYSAVDETKGIMRLQGNIMYEILSSHDLEIEVEKYKQKTSNRFFKTFMSLAFVNLKFGDKKINDKSMFLTNLNYIKQELNMEILKREKMNHIFNAITFVILSPLFVLKYLKSWTVSSFPELVSYYNSELGFIVQIVILAIILGIYLIVLNMKKLRQEDSKILNDFFSFVMKKEVVVLALRRHINRNYTKARKLKELIKQSGSKDTIETHYLKRFMFFIVIFIVSIFSTMQVYQLKQQQILGHYSNFELNEQSKQEDIEDYYINSYKNKRVNEILLLEELKVLFPKNTEEELQSSVQVIKKQVKIYNNQYFKWYNLIICLTIAYICSFIPYLLIIFKKTMLQMELEDEVMQLHSIILMLMNIDRVDVLLMLEWLENFSDYFKISISKCTNDFSQGDIEALKQLKEDEPYVPFARIVDNLISACDKISIKKAFEEIEVERNFYQDKRKQDNEIILHKKKVMVDFIALMPAMSVIILYLVLPIVLLSVTQLMEFSVDMNGLF